MFYPLCLDEETYSVVDRLGVKNIKPVALSTLEKWDIALLEAKQNRSIIEYYFTLSPVFPLYLLETEYVDVITYLDADLLFYNNPEPIYKELDVSSILITSHHFPPSLKHKEKYGLFNIQYQSFRNDDQGKRCLRRWREQCLEWCYDRYEDGRFADQKYLDEWPKLYDQLVISQNRGVGIAPWNINSYKTTIKDDHFLVDGEEVIFYHFHGLKIFSKRLLSHGIGTYKIPDHSIIYWLYSNYIYELDCTQKWLNKIGLPSVNSFTISDRRKGYYVWVHILYGLIKRQLVLLKKEIRV